MRRYYKIGLVIIMGLGNLYPQDIFPFGMFWYTDKGFGNIEILNDKSISRTNIQLLLPWCLSDNQWDGLMLQPDSNFSFKVIFENQETHVSDTSFYLSERLPFYKNGSEYIIWRVPLNIRVKVPESDFPLKGTASAIKPDSVVGCDGQAEFFLLPFNTPVSRAEVSIPQKKLLNSYSAKGTKINGSRFLTFTREPVE